MPGSCKATRNAESILVPGGGDGIREPVGLRKKGGKRSKKDRYKKTRGKGTKKRSRIKETINQKIIVNEGQDPARQRGRQRVVQGFE